MEVDFVKLSVWIVNKYKGVLFKAGPPAVQLTNFFISATDKSLCHAVFSTALRKFLCIC